jgi:hypothetical protein
MPRVKRSLPASLCLLIVACFLATASLSAFACTRAVYIGSDADVITGRSMDWKVDVGTNLWIFPRGMHRDGAAGPHSFEWTSKYGSVIATGYDVSSTDGMNERDSLPTLFGSSNRSIPNQILPSLASPSPSGCNMSSTTSRLCRKP